MICALDTALQNAQTERSPYVSAGFIGGAGFVNSRDVVVSGVLGRESSDCRSTRRLTR